MKNFFDRLFGKKGPAEVAEKRAAAADPSPPPDESFQPYQSGDVIAGKYEVRRVLGKGGCGIVYLIRLRETGEDFALKTFKDELTADPAALDAFKKEALVWVNLERHPFILPAFWVEEIRQGRMATSDGSGKLVLDARSSQEPHGRLLVIMDYVEADAQGRANLGDYLTAGPLDESQVLTWGMQFCLGMEHVRAHGVECHRDIKPANIMITKDGTLKISDFGLAIATESAWRGIAGRGSAVAGKGGEFGLSVVQSEGKVICGTPGYIAPEICRAEGASVRSDIYSFGLVLWQMAAGSPVPPFRVPWRGDFLEYMRGVYEQQMTGRIPRLNGSLGVVIERCLRPQPAERYGTFQELRAALEPILERRTGRKFEAPQSAGKTAVFWNNKGGSLAALGQHEEAILCYDAALEVDPRSHKTWNNKGCALSALGRSKEALECFERSLAIDPRFAIAFKNRGRELHILGRHEEALHCCDKALSIDSRDTDAWHTKGAVLAAMEMQVEAIACYDRALAINPRSLESLYNKGHSHMRLGKNTEAWTCFDQVLAIDPNFEMAWLNKGNLLVASGRHEDAVPCFDQVIAINSTNAEAHGNKAASLAALGRFEEALASCDRALKADPRRADAWATKGAVLAADRRSADAVVCYEKALAIDERNAVAWCGKGSALAAAGRHSEALICLDRALAIDPKNASALFGKAISEEIEGRLSVAVTSLRRFIEIAGPMYADEIEAAKKHLADLVRREARENDETAGTANPKPVGKSAQELFAEAANLAASERDAEAVLCYEKGLGLDPGNAAAWFNMGHCLGLLGRHRDVVRCCDRALKIHPNFSAFWILKGLGFLSMEQFDDAMACFEKARELGDTNAAARMVQCRMAQAEWYFRLGYRYRQEGNNTEAIACYEKSLARNPSNGVIWVNKGAALLALKRAKEAVDCFDRAIALDPNDSSAWNNKGIALSHLGRSEEGAACLLKALKMRKAGQE